MRSPSFWGACPAVCTLSLWDLGNQALRMVPGAHVPMDVATLVTKAALWKHPIGAQA